MMKGPDTSLMDLRSYLDNAQLCLASAEEGHVSRGLTGAGWCALPDHVEC